MTSLYTHGIILVLVDYQTGLWEKYLVTRDWSQSEIIIFTVNKHKYWDRWAWANSVEPDETPQNEVFDQGPHCLQPIQLMFLHINKSSRD